MTTVFNGKTFAENKELVLAKKALKLRQNGVYPKLAAVIIGDDPVSLKYIQIKKKVAEKVGCEVDEYRISKFKTLIQALHLIKFLDSDETISGIMIQLPLPSKWKKYESKLINAISNEKDVDGHKEDSAYLPATVKAIISIMQKAEVTKTDQIMVVGSKGEVGSRLISFLKSEKYKVSGCDKSDFKTNFNKNADVVISATGTPDLITEEMVKQGVVVIDVGYPLGDVNFKQVSKKAKFITPVPGGVGPVTVISLMENLIGAASKSA